MVALSLVLLCFFVPSLIAMAIMLIREYKQQEPNRISREIISIAMRNVEERNTDDLDEMIRYFKEQEQQVRYNIKG